MCGIWGRMEVIAMLQSGPLKVAFSPARASALANNSNRSFQSQLCKAHGRIFPEAMLRRMLATSPNMSQYVRDPVHADNMEGSGHHPISSPNPSSPQPTLTPTSPSVCIWSNGNQSRVMAKHSDPCQPGSGVQGVEGTEGLAGANQDSQIAI